MNELRKLPQIIHHCMTIGEIPTSYRMSMSYAEQLTWFCHFLETQVIPVVNNNSQVVQELKTYVEEYFDNLDVQEEVNTKLEAMAEDGTLEALINDEILQDIQASITNLEGDVEEINQSLENELPEYKVLHFTQNLALNFGQDKSIQSFCIDDNNCAYIYEITTEPFGNLYKYNLVTKDYVNVAENVKLYHGNSMCYLNGKIYVATLKTDGTTFDSKKICVYDITSGTITEINPLSAETYQNTVAVATLDSTHIIVAMCEDATLSTIKMHYFKLDTTNLTSEEITISYDKEITPTTFVDIAVIKDKFYLVTNANSYIMEFLITENGLQQTKIYKLNKKNELGVDIGEVEGITILPSGLYGDYTFAISTYLNGNQSHGTANYYIYLSNLKGDLVDFYGDNDNSNILNHIISIHVNSDSQENLENGSSTYPFKDINVAIAYANSQEANVDFIVIDNSATYELGKHNNERIYIKTANNTINVTLKLTEFSNCDMKFVGSNISLERASTSLQNINIDNCKFDLYQCKLKTYLYVQKGSQLFFNYIDVDEPYNEANVIYMANSTANLYIHTIAGTFTRLLNLREGSHVILNKAHESQAAAVLTGSVLTIAQT